METFLKSLKNETKMYRSTALKINDARRDLNVEYEGARVSSSRLLRSNRPKTVAEKTCRDPVNSSRMVATSRNIPESRIDNHWETTVWVTNAPSTARADRKSTKEYKQGTLTSRAIEVDFGSASPKKPRVWKTPECVKRMKPDTSDYVTENDSFYDTRVNYLFVEGKKPC